MNLSLRKDDPKEPASILAPSDISDDVSTFFSRKGVPTIIERDVLRTGDGPRDRVVLGDSKTDMTSLRGWLDEWNADTRRRQRDEYRQLKQKEEE